MSQCKSELDLPDETIRCVLEEGHSGNHSIFYDDAQTQYVEKLRAQLDEAKDLLRRHIFTDGHHFNCERQEWKKGEDPRPAGCVQLCTDVRGFLEKLS